MAKSEDPASVLKSIRKDKSPHNIYLLYGDEPYFTDKIERKLVSTYMSPDAMDFNYTLLYGNETNGADVTTAVMRYPMMSERVVVVVREAQHLSGLDPLEALTTRLPGSNILILSFKGAKPDSRQKAFKALEKAGLAVESKEIREYEMHKYIDNLADEHGLKLDSSALQMLMEHLGTDIVQIDKELEKLEVIAKEGGSSLVTTEMIEKYTSVTRQVSIFELKSALANKDRGKATKLGIMMSNDPKGSPVQATVSMLFNYFSDLLIAFYAPDKTEGGVMRHLGLAKPFQVRDFMAGLRNYSAPKVINIISYLRKCDARSKGMYGGYTDQGEVIMDLIYFILH